MLPEFPKTSSYTILIAMHILTSRIVEEIVKHLNERCSLDVKKAHHGMPVESGTVYFIPIDYHAEIMGVKDDAIITLNKGPKVNFVRPSVDVLMKSVAEVFKENSVGILLTGMGMDGAMGVKAIKDAGGATIVQDEQTSSIFAKPKSAIDLGCVDEVLPLSEINKEVMRIIDEKALNLAVQIQPEASKGE